MAIKTEKFLNYGKDNKKLHTETTKKDGRKLTTTEEQLNYLFVLLNSKMKVGGSCGGATVKIDV